MKIKINEYFNAFGDAFTNIVPGSEHEVIKKADKGWWVMGNGEPVLVLFREAKEI